MPLTGFINKIWKITVSVGTCYQINKALFLDHLLLQPFSHATDESDKQFPVFPLKLTYSFQAAPDTLLCILTYRARIDQYQAGFIYVFCVFKSVIFKYRHNNLAVSYIHLAAICFNIYFFRHPGLKSICFTEILRFQPLPKPTRSNDLSPSRNYFSFPLNTLRLIPFLLTPQKYKL